MWLLETMLSIFAKTLPEQDELFRKCLSKNVWTKQWSRSKASVRSIQWAVSVSEKYPVSSVSEKHHRWEASSEKDQREASRDPVQQKWQYLSFSSCLHMQRRTHQIIDFLRSAGIRQQTLALSPTWRCPILSWLLLWIFVTWTHLLAGMLVSSTLLYQWMFLPVVFHCDVYL